MLHRKAWDTTHKGRQECADERGTSISETWGRLFHSSTPPLLGLLIPAATICHDNSGVPTLFHVGHWFLPGATLARADGR